MDIRQKNIYRKYLVFALLVCLFGGIGVYIYYIRKNIPDIIYLDSYSDGTLLVDLPFVGTVDGKSDGGDTVQTSVNLMEPLTINSGDVSNYELQVELFGIIPIKNITVSVNESRQIVACGIPVGIYIETDGILVVDIGEVVTDNGTIEAPAKGILAPGDYIETVNGLEVATTSELVNAIKNSGEYAEFTIRRNSEIIPVKIKLCRDKEGNMMIGAWVRDDCQGLGTLTYVDDNGEFGTLGHAISDSQTGKIVEIKSGKLYTAKIWSVVKGQEGSPGEIIGSINYGSSSYIGEIDENSTIGVYGETNKNVFAYVDEVYLNVAYKQDIKKGDAVIRTFVEGEVKDYDIEITEIHYSDDYSNKGIVFEVTDEDLLNATNGIVQGMSGSPIIQDDCVIGAVTHVFVNEPEKGYGIFIENMLEH